MLNHHSDEMSNTMAGAKNVFKENGKNEQLTIFE
jgi:hypothetical protein